MKVFELKRILAQCNPQADVFIRLDAEFLEDASSNCAEILGSDYSYGCTETLALALECGIPDSPEVMAERNPNE